MDGRREALCWKQGRFTNLGYVGENKNSRFRLSSLVSPWSSRLSPRRCGRCQTISYWTQQKNHFWWPAPIMPAPVTASQTANTIWNRQQKDVNYWLDSVDMAHTVACNMLSKKWNRTLNAIATQMSGFAKTVKFMLAEVFRIHTNPFSPVQIWFEVPRA